MIELRGYQNTVFGAVREAFGPGRCRAPLVVMPTGSGKTYLFAAIVASAMKRGKRIVILAHRIELVDQIIEALRQFGIDPDVIAAGYARRPGPVYVASVQTLIRRADVLGMNAPDLIITDEAHHCVGHGGNTWGKILAAWPTSKLLGVTATPIRMDGRGLGETFDKLVLGPSVAELTAAGYLAPCRVFAPATVDTSKLHTRAGDYVSGEAEALVDTPAIIGSALNEYRKVADGKPALVFCVSIQHADHVAKQFREAGYAAVMLNGGTDRSVRRMCVEDFKRGAIQVITSCDIFAEGVDLPGCHVGILLRPTQSMGLHRQQIGRILRPCEGKAHAICLDHVGNTLRHGLPDEPYGWSLAYDETTKKAAKPKISVRICAACFAASSSRSRTCTNCGREFPVEPRQVEERKGELTEITPEMVALRAMRREQGRSRSLEELKAFARKRGYHENWALHVWNARQRKHA